MIDRRQFVASAGSLIAVSVVASLRHAPLAAAAPAAGGARLDALFDTFMAERFARSPDLVTILGLDTGKYAASKSKLTSGSLAHWREDKEQNASQLKRLRAFRRAGLSAGRPRQLRHGRVPLETRSRGAPFEYGEVGRPVRRQPADRGLPAGRRPSSTGSTRSRTRADADAYLARLRAFATVLDQETERVGTTRHSRSCRRTSSSTAPSSRCVPCAPVLRPKSILVTSIATRTQKLGIAGSYGADAAQLVEHEVYPALDRQAAALRELRPKAVHDAGVARLPEGATFYQVALRAGTTTGMSAEEVHQLGLEQAKDLTARMDTLLRQQGHTGGTVSERAQALAKDPKYLYANTDAGKQQVLDYCNGLIKALQPHLPKYFRLLPKAPVEIRRVPDYIEAGAPGGYYNIPALDGSRPGAFYINLRDTAEWSRWKLPTLVYHESEPGHHFQLALVLEMPKLPLIRKAGGGFSANTEGWALYAENLVDEMGMYDADPLGRFGMLQSELFRAARCVVDTGLHAKGWSREQAIDYMVDTTGDNRTSMTTEVERYCTWPGQATSYKVGHTRWLKLRAEARQRLGAKFDIRDFHDVGLSAAPMPLSVLDRVVGDWLKGQGV